MNATGDPAFSMFNLSLKEDWMNNRKFCHRLSDDEDEEEDHRTAIREAEHRLAANTSMSKLTNGFASNPSPMPRNESINKPSKIILVQ